MKNLNKLVDQFLEDGKVIVKTNKVAEDLEAALAELGEEVRIFDLGNRILVEKDWGEE